MMLNPAMNWANNLPPNAAAIWQVTTTVAAPNKQGHNFTQATPPPNQEEILAK